MAKTGAKKAVKRPVKKTVKKPATKKGAKPAAAPTAKRAPARKTAPKEESLGRPLVTIEEKLYLLFKEDYHARQIFEFLRVNTVGELEQFSPEQIIEILSRPVRQTVERIREKLAEYKRCLRDDAAFARDFLTARKAAQ